ncbi:hypothetical protein ES708_19075 [subsurface metagenome]
MNSYIVYREERKKKRKEKLRIQEPVDIEKQ